MIPDDDLSEPFVRQPERMQEVIVEEMAERSVPDIVHQGGDPEKLLDEVGRGDVPHGLFEKWIQMPRKPSGHVHGAQGVDEAGMFGRRIDPSGALQLINVPQPLDPGRIDQILFRLLPDHRASRRER